MLEVGYNSHFEVRMETLHCLVTQQIRLVYVSDLHFNKRSEEMGAKILETIRELKPDIVLLGGDYVDTRSGLRHLDALLDGISRLSPVFAIAGNHDRFFGIEAVKQLMLANKVHWIEGSSETLLVKGSRLWLDGNTNTTASEKADVKILCLHKPIALEVLPVTYHAAFAGHLHGSQCVLWQTDKGLFPGRWFYKWNRLKAVIGECHFYISKGLGDTLPIRYNCAKELLVLDLEPTVKV